MTGLQLAVLALVQGISEFLPISSSAHLILVPVFTGWPDQGLMIDIAVHVGTLGAVMVYFCRDVWRMIKGLGRLGNGAGDRDPGVQLTLHVVVATIPVVVAGAALAAVGLSILRSPVLIGWTMLGFGLLLYAADRVNMTIRKIEHMTLAHALFIGVAQALALIPGTSRAGITMTAARDLGYERTEAARFSMLLSIPAIAGAGVLTGVELFQTGDARLTFDAMIAAALAFGFAIAAIAVLMAWLRRSTFTPFAVYRLILGGGLLIWIYAF